MSEQGTRYYDRDVADAYDRQGEQDYYCAHCRQQRKDTSEVAHSELCADCRRELTRLRVPAWVLAFMAALVVLFGVMATDLPRALTHLKGYAQAQRHVEAKEYLYACEKYDGILQEYSDSIRIALKAGDAAINAQLFDYAGYVIDTYLAGRELTDGQYNQAMLIVDCIDPYYAARNAVDEVVAELGDQVNDPAQLRAALEGLLENPENDKTLLYYYLGNTSENREEALRYLELASENNPRFTYPIAVYGNVLRRAQQFDRAREVYQKALEQNALDTTAAVGLGVLELLGGDKARGLEYIRQAHEITPLNIYVPEALIIALCENDQREAALELKAEKEAQEYPFDPELLEYLEGDVTLQDYYMG